MSKIIRRYRIERSGAGKFRVVYKRAPWWMWPFEWLLGRWTPLENRTLNQSVFATCQEAQNLIAAYQSERLARVWTRHHCPCLAGSVLARAKARVCRAAGMQPPCCQEKP